MERIIINATGQTRRAVIAGKEYLVAPLTLIVPGVLNGSKGSLYYPPNEIARNVTAWNGMPLVVYHPISQDGQHVSAGDKGILSKQGVGVVKSARIDNGKLKAEGWFDVERTRQVDQRVYQSLQQHLPIELSTGLYTDNEYAPIGSTHNGKSYEFIARNYRPDHLAILPDQVGACSINDGCGVLVNANPEGINQYSAARINDHLSKGGMVQVSTHTRSTVYTKKHAGMFSEDSKGHLLVKRGKSKDSLGPVEKPHVSIRFSKLPEGTENEDSVKRTIWQRLGEVFGITGNAEQPRHPASGMFQGKAHKSARQGYNSTATDEVVRVSSDEMVEADEPDDHVASAEEESQDDMEEDGAQPSENANPEGHNQYTEASGSEHHPAAVEAVKNIIHRNTGGGKLQRPDLTPDQMEENGKSQYFNQSSLQRAFKNQRVAGKAIRAAYEDKAHVQNAADIKADVAASKAKPPKLPKKSKGGVPQPPTGPVSPTADTPKPPTGPAATATPKPPTAPITTPQSIESQTENTMNNEYVDNASQPGHLEGADRAQVQAAMADMHASGKSDTAEKASEKVATKGTQHERMSAHREASAAHKEAASAHKEGSNKQKYHQAMAKEHASKAKQIHKSLTKNTTMDKQTIIAELVANGCACDTDRQALNNLSDAAWNAMPPALLAAQKKKKGEQDDDEDDDEDEGMERNDDEDTHSFDMKGTTSTKSDQAGGKGTKDEYNTNMQRWLNSMPEQARGVWNNAVEIEKNTRLTLVRRLVANVADNTQRQKLGNQLMRKSLSELRNLSALVPVHNQQPNYAQPEPLFYGANSPTANRQDDDQSDILPLPVANYGEWSKEGKTKQA